METKFIVLVELFLVAATATRSQDTRFEPRDQQIPAPEYHVAGEPLAPGPTLGASEIHETWLADIQHWRSERRIRIGYDGSRYTIPALQWTQSSFIQPQMMVEDRYFYDPVADRYTVDRYLDDLETRYGGIDAVLIWPTYPNLGIDNRNQHDMIRSMPGGIAGVRRMVSEFHRRGVRVFFPMMMWDQGTSDIGRPWPDAIAQLMSAIGADGINGDTQDGVPLAFPAAAERIGHPLAFEPEVGCHDEAIAYNLLTWGQYRYPFIPMVDRYKWLEPRHMVNISDRWSKEKTDNLQFAFFNGVGWESWENIWGIWNGITPRDAEATRRMGTIERAVAAFLVSQDWEPSFPMLRFGVFASRWPMGARTVWTIVNRNTYSVEGPQIELPIQKEMRYFDLYHGAELTPESRGDRVVLSFNLEAKGFGALLATASAPDSSMGAFMRKMKAMTATPLEDFSPKWNELPQQIAPIESTLVPATAPDGMVNIPAGTFVFRARGIEIEGSNDVGVDVQYPWEDSPRRYHEHVMGLKSFWIDKYPVTNEQFKRFLDSSGYHPRDRTNFLRDWQKGTYPKGWANRPVTWVALEDARAYAAWSGKRLPHEWEWQYAAQGTDGRVYPWGNAWDSAAVPVPDSGRTLRGPDTVDAHPSGGSPFGVMDLVGNVWQMTDEFVDEHTRGGILKGGSYYRPRGSMWYFPQAHRLEEHGKLLLMAPSYDRSGTVGFRCVQDAK